MSDNPNLIPIEEKKHSHACGCQEHDSDRLTLDARAIPHRLRHAAVIGAAVDAFQTSSALLAKSAAPAAAKTITTGPGPTTRNAPSISAAKPAASAMATTSPASDTPAAPSNAPNATYPVTITPVTTSRGKRTRNGSGRQKAEVRAPSAANPATSRWPVSPPTTSTKATASPTRTAEATAVLPVSTVTTADRQVCGSSECSSADLLRWARSMTGTGRGTKVIYHYFTSELNTLGR